MCSALPIREWVCCCERRLADGVVDIALAVFAMPAVSSAGVGASQRIILEEWRQAPTSYVAGQPGGLNHLRAVSAANDALCAEMTGQVGE